MAQAWPLDLPQRELIGAAEPLDDNYVASSMDVGPEKRRRRSTIAGGETSYEFMLTEAQALSFKTFYNDDLDEGVEPFAFQTPLGEAANFLIKGAPKLVRNGHNSFRLTLDLVRVP